MAYGYGYNRKNAIQCCCKCPDRVVGCHATCEKYIKSTEEWLEYKKQIDDARFKDSVFLAHHVKAVKTTVAKTKKAKASRRKR